MFVFQTEWSQRLPGPCPTARISTLASSQGATENCIHFGSSVWCHQCHQRTHEFHSMITFVAPFSGYVNLRFSCQPPPLCLDSSSDSHSEAYQLGNLGVTTFVLSMRNGSVRRPMFQTPLSQQWRLTHDRRLYVTSPAHGFYLLHSQIKGLFPDK